MSTLSIYSRRRKPDLENEILLRFTSSSDFEYRRIHNGNLDFFVCWLDGLVSGRDISEEILRPLSFSSCSVLSRISSDPVASLLSGIVWACAAKEQEIPEKICEDLLSGCCAVIPKGAERAAVFEVKSSLARAVSAPTAEKTVKGGKDAFVELLRSNTALVRRRLRSHELKILQCTVGRRSKTAVAILYIEGVTNASLPPELLRRFQAMDVDGLMNAGGLEQYITDRPGSIFPQLLHTERPDSFASALLDGRAGVLVDGLPLGFLLPAALPDFLRVADDKAQHFGPASLLVLLRWLSLVMSLLLPGLATAVALYHQEMIPTRLLLSMVEAKQRVPFSATLEMLSMFLIFELLIEAGLRLPDPVGDTVSIIGGLIIGQAAVEARVVSPISVIVVAATSIFGFVIPSRDLGGALRFLRFSFIILGSALGLFGVTLGAGVLLRYLVMLESFGTPYCAPLSEGGLLPALKAMMQLPLPLDKFRTGYA